MESQEAERKSLDAKLEEYKSLRTESLNTINNRITLTGYSLGSLTLIGSITVSAKVPDLIVALILAFVVPILASTVALVWIGEYERSQRAGSAICVLEDEIGTILPHNPLRWETNLRSTAKAKLDAPYQSMLLLFKYIAVASQLFSTYYFFLSCLDPGSTLPKEISDILFSKKMAASDAILLTICFTLSHLNSFSSLPLADV